MKKTLKIYFCGRMDSWGLNNLDESEYLQILKRFFHVQLVKPSQADYFFVNESRSSRKDFFKNFRWEVVSIFISGEAYVPDFNIFDYAIGFDHLELQDRYLRFDPAYRFRHHLTIVPNSSLEVQLRHFCDFIYSNFLSNKKRDDIYKELNNYKPVCSYGAHLNNAGRILEELSKTQTWQEAKINLESRHKFSIAAENAFHFGYTSEKVFDSFAAGTVPIYWGNPNISFDVNPARIINAHAFDTLATLREYVEMVDQNDELYIEILSAPFFSNLQLESTKNFPKRLESFLLNIFESPLVNAQRKGNGTFNFSNFKVTKYGFYFGNSLRLVDEARNYKVIPKRLRSKLINFLKRRFDGK